MMSEIAEQIIAKVGGEAISVLPTDLYIPPDALEVVLETFEGPLDLLLYLIKKHNVDILDIPVAKITAQYMAYIDLMQELRLELAAEYLLMAAMLAEIKSRMLLPRPVEEDADEDDPRAELIRRLQEYEQFKKAAEDLSELPRLERDFVSVGLDMPELQIEKPRPQVDMKQLLSALKDVYERAKLNAHHHVQADVLSVRERMTQVLGKLRSDGFTSFSALFDVKEGRIGVVVTFIALLELIRQSLIEMVQQEPFAPIHVKAL